MYSFSLYQLIAFLFFIHLLINQNKKVWYKAISVKCVSQISSLSKDEWSEYKLHVW